MKVCGSYIPDEIKDVINIKHMDYEAGLFSGEVPDNSEVKPNKHLMICSED